MPRQVTVCLCEASPGAARQRGFTLIELMIVVVVVSILASIAVPSFMNSIRKGRRADAVAALAELQQAQERHRANNPTYASALTGSGSLGLSSTASPSGYYTLAISGTPTATTYTVTATANSGQSQASDTGCTVLTAAYSATATPTLSYTPSACWSR